ncbi:MAG: radical SAM protein [Clostridia bacterium]|nr:radical SAM protein [Clostridia bacterium]
MAKDYYVVPIFVPHQGCPHDCVFCNQKRISGVDRQLKSEEIRYEIDSILSTLDYDHNPRVEIAFFGGSFTGIDVPLQEMYLAIGYDYVQRGLVDALRLSTRPDYIDDEILKRLKRYGVAVVELGVQSMHDDVLVASNRGHSRMDVLRACNLIKSYGFTLGVQLMPGLPDDSVSRFKETVDQVLEIAPDIIRLYPTLVIRDTALALDYEAGLYQPMSLEDAVQACAYGLERFLERGIDVIRIGLQPTEAVSESGDVLAGPFHPSFRQLVEGELFRRRLMHEIEAMEDMDLANLKGKKLNIRCRENQISSVSGLNKRNKEALLKKYGFSNIKIIGVKAMMPYTIVIEVF